LVASMLFSFFLCASSFILLNLVMAVLMQELQNAIAVSSKVRAKFLNSDQIVQMHPALCRCNPSLSSTCQVPKTLACFISLLSPKFESRHLADRPDHLCCVFRAVKIIAFRADVRIGGHKQVAQDGGLRDGHLGWWCVYH
jgi:hypothetical protein